MLPELWFWLSAILLVGYVVLDGYDLGAGALHLLVARTDAERRAVFHSIGPFWDGNEVWLLAAGGTLFFAYPALYASSFAGFYLPLMMVLWLLMLRGIAIEFREHIESEVWSRLWDAAFGLASAALAFFFGTALGNVVRGVPLDAQGDFFLPLWTDFRVSAAPGIIDWYTASVGLLALAALAQHGALWIALRTAGPLRLRAMRAARVVWVPVAALTLLVTAFTWAVQPRVPANLRAMPWGWIFPVAALAGLIGCVLFTMINRATRAFLASSLYLAAMLASAAFGLFPYLLPAAAGVTAHGGLTVYNSATGAHGLAVGLAWWLPGMALAVGYSAWVHRRFSGKVV